MSSSQVPNHPVTYSSHFEPLTDSTFDTVRANQYGFVKAPSFIQCGGVTDEKSENFEVQLVTNTALTNVLESEFIYAVSVTRVCATGPNQPEFTNKTFISSLGLITHRQEVAPDAADTGVSLQVIVAHSDWDAENRGHKKFDVKYIVPGTKNLTKTNSLYAVGREVKIIGRLIDFNMETNMAVVLVNHVSVTNGHQLGKIKPADAVAGNNGAGEIKKKLTKFSPKSHGEKTCSATPETPSGSRASPITPSFSARKPAPAAKLPPNLTPTKGKQKAQDVLDDEEEAMFDKEEADASEPEPEPAPAAPESSKRGRPRKSILQEAAKRMKKF
ncbi:hypothetical protein PTTG_27476 [Puccinia triticina 1-1 BBBD Race 1]|uniref:Uncharacterized protein n=1 Tax=Puccinia triticina (isolate 1-1 / race 1 (BBBD)) TaxID=630390 RepID=A0A180GJU0_PUCT1|nr:hypothetical protein PTTG_27476 [Puccinia triticina 1-1 BBBD Race 1]